jgi:FAD synthase
MYIKWGIEEADRSNEQKFGQSIKCVVLQMRCNIYGKEVSVTLLQKIRGRYSQV